jgi:hypothetical protein
MSIELNDIIILSIPERYSKVLQLWASERNLRGVSLSFTAEKIAVEILCEYIDETERMESRLKS